ncbi:hypothetical protein A0H81_02790 [Grifola frondosa]|uniref:Uncharacterized protein n=1 Tax=Grifola frondosa TaxID=5627 RepID=A0A1C7MTR9_GRIFR|nr:hypothetical protein A0H81_02790 [Grifola frondosa]
MRKPLVKVANGGYGVTRVLVKRWPTSALCSSIESIQSSRSDLVGSSEYSTDPLEMRLLNTKTLALKEFLDADHAPPYAILSHRWRKDEVLFDHIHNLAEAEKLQGFSKVRMCCDMALKDHFDWVWIDTCCIDKTSSSELSEAINSMFSWYRKSEVCYAYLDDVDPQTTTYSHYGEFKRSEWFRRGWTLQELIAPNQVVFFAEDWSEIGTRRLLVNEINIITYVDREVLLGLKLPAELGVAERMSWASKRNTTRVEDMAYCLMGLFDVHMPTIYGEGKRAFIRLQHEIMRSTTDHSIFAWDIWNLDNGAQDILAPEPSPFINIIRPTPYKDFAQLFRIDSYSPEYTLTNHGIRIRLPMEEHTLPNGKLEHIVALACVDGRDLVGLRVQRVEGTTDQYCRVGIVHIDNLDPESFTMKNIYLVHHTHSRTLDVRPQVSITLLPVHPPLRYILRQVSPPRRWDVGTSGELSMTIANGRAGSYRSIVVLQQENEYRTAKIGAVFEVRYTKENNLSHLAVALLVDGRDIWPTIDDYDTSDAIWVRYQSQKSCHWDLKVNLEMPCERRMHQISRDAGTRVIHLMTDTRVQPGTNHWIIEVNFVTQANPPYLRGWSLVWFLGAILGCVPWQLKDTVWAELTRGGWSSHKTPYFLAHIFIYESEAWRIRDIPEAMYFKTMPTEELWRTYFEKK